MKEQVLNKFKTIVAKEEKAHDEQYCLLPQCFQKAFDREASVGGKGLKDIYSKCLY